MSKKMSRKLVPVGTHIDPTTKVILQALAESQDTTIYALIQEMIDKTVKEYEEELDSLRGEEVSEAESAPDDELLG